MTSFAALAFLVLLGVAAGMLNHQNRSFSQSLFFSQAKHLPRPFSMDFIKRPSLALPSL